MGKPGQPVTRDVMRDVTRDVSADVSADVRGDIRGDVPAATLSPWAAQLTLYVQIEGEPFPEVAHAPDWAGVAAYFQSSGFAAVAGSAVSITIVNREVVYPCDQEAV